LTVETGPVLGWRSPLQVTVMLLIAGVLLVAAGYLGGHLL
jgi:hypothetical protein